MTQPFTKKDKTTLANYRSMSVRPSFAALFLTEKIKTFKTLLLQPLFSYISYFKFLTPPSHENSERKQQLLNFQKQQKVFSYIQNIICQNRFAVFELYCNKEAR